MIMAVKITRKRISAGLSVAAGYGVWNLQVGNNPMNYFRPGDPIYTSRLRHLVLEARRVALLPDATRLAGVLQPTMSRR